MTHESEPADDVREDREVPPADAGEVSPTDPTQDEETDVIQEAPIDELTTVTRERDEYLDALQRLKAEFDNFRKRAQRDQADLITRASERLVKQLLPVVDDLERALEAAAAHEEAQLEEGVRLVHRALADALARRGPRRGRDRRRVRPAHAGGAALAAVRGRRGHRHPGAAEGLPAGRPRAPAGARRRERRPPAGETGSDA